MYVNPFWFGVLVTLISEVVIMFICGFIAVKRAERYEEECHDEEEEDDDDVQY